MSNGISNPHNSDLSAAIDHIENVINILNELPKYSNGRFCIIFKATHAVTTKRVRTSSIYFVCIYSYTDVKKTK